MFTSGSPLLWRKSAVLSTWAWSGTATVMLWARLPVTTVSSPSQVESAGPVQGPRHITFIAWSLLQKEDIKNPTTVSAGRVRPSLSWTPVTAPSCTARPTTVPDTSSAPAATAPAISARVSNRG